MCHLFASYLNLIPWEDIQWLEHCGHMVQVPHSGVHSSFVCNEQEVQSACAAQTLEEMLRLRRQGLVRGIQYALSESGCCYNGGRSEGLGHGKGMWNE